MISDALRILRVFNNLTLVELAGALGIHASFISEVETGKRKPSLELIEKYAKHFKLRTSSILFFAEELDSKSLKGKAKDALNVYESAEKLKPFVEDHEISNKAANNFLDMLVNTAARSKSAQEATQSASQSTNKQDEEK